MTALQQRPPDLHNLRGETEEERTARVERLLKAAAPWEPENPAPADLIDRVQARLEHSSPLSGRPRVLRTWVLRTWVLRTWVLRTWVPGTWVLGASAVAAAALLLIARPEPLSRPINQPLSRLPQASAIDTSPALEAIAHTPLSVSRTRPGAGVIPVADSSSERLPEPTETPLTPEVSPRITRISRAGYRPASLRRSRPRRWRAAAAAVAAATRTAAQAARRPSTLVTAPGSDPIWEEEVVATEKYRVLVPVVCTSTSEEDGATISVPAVMEVTFTR